MKRKITALVLSALLVCTMCILPANAAEKEAKSVTPRSAGPLYATTSGGTSGTVYCEFLMSENSTEGMQYVTARTRIKTEDVNMGSGSDIQLKLYDGSTKVLTRTVSSNSSTGDTLYITAEVTIDDANNAKADHYVYIAGYGSAERQTTIEW